MQPIPLAQSILTLLAASAPNLSVTLEPSSETGSWDGRSRAVHEWGTFTSVQGSNGVALEGLEHEQWDLPPFVYDLRDDFGLTGMSPKMETPVIYFYSPDPWAVRVQVGFPNGLITQWYPGANRVNLKGRQRRSPQEMQAGPQELSDGFIDWGRMGDLEVLGRDSQVGILPVAEDDPWRFSREVAANTLRVTNLHLPIAMAEAAREGRAVDPMRDPVSLFEHERFLFYRGLGDFELPLVCSYGTSGWGPSAMPSACCSRIGSPKRSCVSSS